MKMRIVAVIVLVMVVVSVVSANKRVHRSRRGSGKQVTNTQGKRGLAEIVASFLPNTYYSRPKFRYPFYHRDGKGELLYGYGDPNKVYQYSIFKPLEGYFK